MKEYIKKPLGAYIVHHIPPIECLHALLEDNPVEAIGISEYETVADLLEAYRYIHKNAYSVCWGSPDKVKAWLEEGA